jgi:succinate CoA transferase
MGRACGLFRCDNDKGTHIAASESKFSMLSRTGFPIITADEAAQLIPHNSLVAFSGFTAAGSAKAVPEAMAARATRIHERGQPYQVRVLTGASTGPSLDGALAEAKAISWRAPYQSSVELRKQINNGDVAFVDMHLSHVPRSVLFKLFGEIDVAVIEATEVTSDGRVYLSSSIGASPTFLKMADKVIIEMNQHHTPRISDLADIVMPQPPPRGDSVSLSHPLQKIGRPYALVDPRKIIGIVKTNKPDELDGFSTPDAVSHRIAGHVVRFLLEEMLAGHIPDEFLPLQSGVGNVANAVLQGLGEHPEIPQFLMYSEVFQSAAFELLKKDKILGGSTCALALAPDDMREFVEGIDEFGPRVVLRPQEISNNSAIVRQLGVIALNTALEIDLQGHVNSTHVYGQRMMNGIGGSGDFARNSFLSIFVCPSTAKAGAISTIVPMCPHVDHSEHSVAVVVTEHGLADLRGLDPNQRAELIIRKCAHPAYRDYLSRYCRETGAGHIRHDLSRCFELHQNLLELGCMLPGTVIEPESGRSCGRAARRPATNRHGEELDEGLSGLRTCQIAAASR